MHFDIQVAYGQIFAVTEISIYRNKSSRVFFLFFLLHVCLHLFVYCEVSGLRHGGVSRPYPAWWGQCAESAGSSPRRSHSDPRSDAALAAFSTTGGQHVPQPHKPRPHVCRACTQVLTDTRCRNNNFSTLMITYLWFFFKDIIQACCSIDISYICFYFSQSWCEWSGDKGRVWDDGWDLRISWGAGVRHRDSEDQSYWTAALQSAWHTHTSRWVGVYTCFQWV